MKDLLLFARPPQPRFEPVEMGRLLGGTASLLHGDPALAHIRVTLSGTSPPIAADPGLLQIVFLNLLINAAHAISGAGDIQVTISSGDSRCLVRVRDTGPGIPAEIRQRIFTPFFTTKARGTGLGLATAKRVIDAHHGRIDVECPPEGGTTVVVELPFEQ
jgi:signal transduction histidine kinase